MNPILTAELLVGISDDLDVSIIQNKDLLEAFELLQPTMSSPERSQILQESQLWHNSISASDPLLKWRDIKQTKSRIMADALHAQAFPLRPSSSTNSSATATISHHRTLRRKKRTGKKKANKANKPNTTKANKPNTTKATNTTKSTKTIKTSKSNKATKTHRANKTTFHPTATPTTTRRDKEPWNLRQPRGDLIKGLDGLTEVEAMKQWKESLGPQSFRLGKAKASIQLYQKCVAEQDDIQANIIGDLELERYEHSQTQQKLISQEMLFGDLLKRCAIMEANTRNGNTDNVEEQLHLRLHEAAASSTTLEGVMASARAVSDLYLDDVQRCIDLGQQRYEDLEQSLRNTNHALHSAEDQIKALQLKLQRMTHEGQRLNTRNEELRNTEADLVQRSMAADRAAAAEKRRRIRAEDVLARQSGEVATFVHSMMESCKKHFGFVPPNIASVGVFFSPNIVQIPFKTPTHTEQPVLALHE